MLEDFKGCLELFVVDAHTCFTAPSQISHAKLTLMLRVVLIFVFGNSRSSDACDQTTDTWSVHVS